MPVLYKCLVVLFAILIGSQIQNSAFDYILAFLLILIFGVPHGATDHALTNWIKSKRINTKPTQRFLLSYNAVIIAYGIMWYFFPAFSLLVFLWISAFHFGETQFHQLKMSKSKSIILQPFWGFSVLLIILFSDINYLSSLIAPYLISEESLLWIQANQVILLLVPLVVTLTLSFTIHWKVFVKELIELGLIAVIAFNTSLLFAFAVFFAFWHSRDAVMHQVSKLRLENQKFRWTNWAKMSLPFTALSLMGMGMLIGAFYTFSINIPLVTAFFILVALITMPHVIVMSRFYKA